METREVLLLLTDRWGDWEASFAIAEVNSVPQYVVKTVAIDRKPKASIGGIRAEIDYAIDDFSSFDRLAMLILPGGFSWQESRHEEIAAFIKKARDFKVPIAAICGATIFLGKHGFLDNTKHTGDDLEFFQKERGYNGQEHYVRAQIIADNGIITANETAALDFAREIFSVLKIDTEEEIALWHEKFKKGAVPE